MGCDHCGGSKPPLNNGSHTMAALGLSKCIEHLAARIATLETQTGPLVRYRYMGKLVPVGSEIWVETGSLTLVLMVVDVTDGDHMPDSYHHHRTLTCRVNLIEEKADF